MTAIRNDQDLRALLERLSAAEQRLIGARFAESVSSLSRDARVAWAIKAALDPEADPVALRDAFQGAKAWAAKTYTDCGKDTDWLAQADHFVAEAIVAALTPENQLSGKTNRAWKAAMQARMAKNCALVEGEPDAEEGGEAARQYAIAADFVVAG